MVSIWSEVEAIAMIGDGYRCVEQQGMVYERRVRRMTQGEMILVVGEAAF
jgi:hypothetical protein